MVIEWALPIHVLAILSMVEVGIAGLQKVAPTTHHTITLARTVSKKMNAHIQFLPGVPTKCTVYFQLVVQKSRRESAHARTLALILNRKFCACANSRWTTNWKSGSSCWTGFWILDWTGLWILDWTLDWTHSFLAALLIFSWSEVVRATPKAGAWC